MQRYCAVLGGLKHRAVRKHLCRCYAIVAISMFGKMRRVFDYAFELVGLLTLVRITAKGMRSAKAAAKCSLKTFDSAGVAALWHSMT